MRSVSVPEGTLLLTAVSLVIRGLTMLFQIFLSGRIGAGGLGLMQLISTVYLLALTLGSAGTRVAAMYLIAEEYGRGNRAGVRSALSVCLRLALLASCLCGALLICAAPPIASRLLGDAGAARGLMLCGLFLPVSALNSVMTGYFTACGKLRRMIGVELGERIASILLTVLLLRGCTGSADSCAAVYAGSGIAGGLSFLTLYAICRRELRGVPLPASDPQMRTRLRALCLPLTANDCLRSGLSTLEHLLIPYGLRLSGSSGAEAMEAYGVIHGMTFPVLMFSAVILWSLADVLVPELSKCRAEGRGFRVRYLAGRALRLSLLFSCAVGGFLFCFSAPLGELLYHRQDTGRYIALLAPTVPVLYMDAIVDGMHKGLGQQLSCVRYNTLTSSLDVVLLLLLLPRYGVRGYLFAFVFTHVLNFWLSIRRLLVVTGLRLSLLRVLRVLVCTGGAAAVMRLLPFPVSSPGALLAGGALYLSLLALSFLLTGALSDAELRALRLFLHRKEPQAF